MLSDEVFSVAGVGWKVPDRLKDKVEELFYYKDYDLSSWVVKDINGDIFVGTFYNVDQAMSFGLFIDLIQDDIPDLHFAANEIYNAADCRCDGPVDPFKFYTLCILT